MPKPIRHSRSGARVCVFHRRECAWAGADHVESRECRAATPDDRDRGLGVFAMPAPPLGPDEPLLRLVAEADGRDPDEAVAAEHHRVEEWAERNLAEWRRRDRQPWSAWLAEEQAKTPPSAQERQRLVDRLVAEIEHRTEETR